MRFRAEHYFIAKFHAYLHMHIIGNIGSFLTFAGCERKMMTAVSEGGPGGVAPALRQSQLTETREAAGSNSETSQIHQKLALNRAGTI